MANRYHELSKEDQAQIDVIINRKASHPERRRKNEKVDLNRSPNRYHELSKEDQAQIDDNINDIATERGISYEISIEWSTLDVQDRRPDLSFQDAVKVLEAVKRGHDASVGVNWDVLQAQIDFMYPKTCVDRP